MASKYIEVYPDTKDLFEKHLDEINLDNYGVSVTILADNAQKKLHKLVKANDLLKHMSGNDLVVIINEVIFEKLTDEQKIMVVEEILSPVHFDTEKEKLIISQPDISTYSGFLSKYGQAKYIMLLESVKTLYAAAENGTISEV